MSAPSQVNTVITPVCVGGHWCVVKIENSKTTTFLSTEVDYKTSRHKACQLAETFKFPFEEREFLLDKPVITIFHSNKTWQILKIFHDTYKIKEIKTNESDALELAEKIAKNEKLDFLPLLGHAVFNA